MPNQLNLSDIQAFVAIADKGSFTLAAEAQRCSRSYLSRQLTQLEEQLGVKLMVRTTRRLRLTEEGQQFYQRCKTALQGIDEAVASALDHSQDLKGVIRINSVGGYIGEMMIAPLVSAFMQANPGIEVVLDFSSHRVDLVQDAFDIVFRMGALEDSGLIARKLMDIDLLTLASPGYIADYGEPHSPTDLQQHRCILGSVKQWRFHSRSEPKKTVDVPVSGVLECSNGRVMLSAALAGQGVIRVPALYCQAELAAGALRPVLSDWCIPGSPFYMMYVQDPYQPLRIKRFVDFVLEQISLEFPDAHG